MNLELQTKTVLLVEDNEDDIFLMRRILKKAGIGVKLQVATDGKMATQYLSAEGDFGDRERYPLPDLIFLDIKLPFLHGFEVLAWMRQRPKLSGMPVMILSSSLEDQDRERAKALGVPYLVKPPTVEMVNTALRSIIVT